jgi:hypothetical protein
MDIIKGHCKFIRMNVQRQFHGSGPSGWRWAFGMTNKTRLLNTRQGLVVFTGMD